MHPEQSDNKNKKVVAILAVLLVTVLVVVGVKAFKPKQSNAMNAGGDSSSNAATASTSNAAYKDGTYTVDGNYQSPGGAEAIKVSLTIKNNAVVDSSVKPSVTTDDDAQEFQNDFINGYKTLVVGKNMNDIRVSRVSGSSLTSEGFNNALEQIKNQAKA